MATHPETIAAAQEALATYGTGACGSPVLSGMTDLHHRLERRMSGFLGRESTMLFNSGFGGALGSLSGYDYIHYASHRVVPRTRVGRFIQRNHLLHHSVTPRARWGVSSPFWDHVFGTTGASTPGASARR